MLTTDPRQTQRNYRNNDGVSVKFPISTLTTPGCMLGGVRCGDEPASHTHTNVFKLACFSNAGVFNQLAEATQGQKRHRKTSRSQIHNEAIQGRSAGKRCS